MQKTCIAILIIFFTAFISFSQTQEQAQTPEQWANQLKTARFRGTLDALIYFFENPSEAKKLQKEIEDFSKTCELDMLKSWTESILAQVKAEPPKSDPAHIKELIKILKESKDEKVLRPVFEEITKIGPAAKETAPELIRILTEKPEGTFGFIIPKALLAAKVDVNPVISDLTKKYQSTQDIRVKGHYAIAISSFGPKAESAVPVLLPALDSPDDQVKGRPILALGYIHCCNAQIIPKLVANLKNGSFPVKQACCMALSSFTPASKEAIEALILAMQDSAGSIRESAIRTLGLLGEYAEPALPALKLSLKDENSRIQTEAAKSIKMIEFRKK